MGDFDLSVTRENPPTPQVLSSTDGTINGGEVAGLAPTRELSLKREAPPLLPSLPPRKIPSYYAPLSKGFGAASGVLGTVGLVSLGVGVVNSADAFLTTTSYVLSPLPWLGARAPDVSESARMGERWLMVGFVVTGAALTTTLLSIIFAAKHRSLVGR